MFNINSTKGEVNRLIELLSSISPLSDDFVKTLKKELTYLSLPKNYLLLEAPKVSEHAYYIQCGFAMSYTFDRGRKVVERFWGPNEIVVSVKSFFCQVPSEEFIQLLEPSEILFVRYEAVKRMLAQYPEADAIYRAVIAQYFGLYRQRVRNLHELSARKRFDLLVSETPQIQQLVPQEYIASYLGITPQSLSRIKAKHPRD